VTRLPAIDFVRGLVMLLMTIDHAREYQAGPGLGSVTDPMDLNRVTPFLFFLRWISHFCAPTFAVLMGVGVWLSSRRQLDPAHLLKRGLVLLALEATIINWCWTFNPLWHRYFFQVIAALGFGMLALAATVRLGRATVLTIGAVIVFGHNLLDGISFDPGTWQHYAWSILHQKNVLPLWGGFEFRTTYPVLPIVGLALCGYGMGPWFESLAGRRRLFRAGLVLCALFLVLRTTNLYGDMSQFELSPHPARTLMSLGNTTKYPLSLQFILMTTGPALLFLAKWNREVPFASTLGRVPMFYYIAHLFALHALVWIYAFALGYRWADFAPMRNFGGVPVGVTFPLWVTVPFALGTAVLLWPLCRWYASIRSRYPALRYL
jgi:uncharacterized membrane protein